jgi:hypothetical protein
VHDVIVKEKSYVPPLLKLNEAGTPICYRIKLQGLLFCFSLTSPVFVV